MLRLVKLNKNIYITFFGTFVSGKGAKNKCPQDWFVPKIFFYNAYIIVGKFHLSKVSFYHDATIVFKLTYKFAPVYNLANGPIASDKYCY